MLDNKGHLLLFALPLTRSERFVFVYEQYSICASAVAATSDFFLLLLFFYFAFECDEQMYKLFIQ